MIEELSVEFDVKACCEALGVSRSGFYQWQNPEPGKRAQADAALLERIVEVFHQHKQRYGSPRVTKVLQQLGLVCGENRVARLMREHELVARPNRPFRPRTTQAGGEAVAPNRIKALTPSGPDQIWGERYHVCGDPRRVALPGRDPGFLQPLGGGLEGGRNLGSSAGGHRTPKCLGPARPAARADLPFRFRAASTAARRSVNRSLYWASSRV
jgi:hypothetical protein